MGAAVGNIIATIMATQTARKSAALMPIVRPIAWEAPIIADCQMRTPQATAASVIRTPRMMLRSRRSGRALVVAIGALLVAPPSRRLSGMPCLARSAALAALCVGPVDRRVMAVLARVIPAHTVVGPGAVGVADCHCHAGGKGMGVHRPQLVFRIKAGEGIDGQVHHAGNLDGTMLALFLKGDRRWLHAQHGGNQGREGRHWTTSRAGED